MALPGVRRVWHSFSLEVPIRVVGINPGPRMLVPFCRILSILFTNKRFGPRPSSKPDHCRILSRFTLRTRRREGECDGQLAEA